MQISRLSILFFCIGIFSSMIGCGAPSVSSNGTPAENSKLPQDVKKMFDEPAGPLPALAGPSKFQTEVGKESFPSSEAVDPPPLLRWDFSAKKVVAYSYSQTVESSTMLGNSQTPMTQKMQATGDLLIKSQGGGTANFVLNNVTMKMTADFPTDATSGKTAPQEMSQTMPPFVLQGMGEDGAAKWGDSDMEMLLKMLFPLPSKALSVGASSESEGKFPINLMGSRIYATGTAKTTLTGYVKIEGAVCARLETETDISKVELPPELTAQCKAALKGRAVFYFDLKDRSFVSGELALMLSMRADMPVPETKFPAGNTPPVSLPKSMRMVMDTDNYIVLKRKPHDNAVR